MLNIGRIRLSYRLQIFLAFLIALSLYVGFLSQNFDANGLIEAANIELGGAYLFTPNHLLYRPVLWIVYRLLQGLGYTGPVVMPAQYFTAIFSAIGVALFWILINQIVDSKLVSTLTTVGFATAWSQWVFSIDAYYITITVITIIIPLIFLVNLYRQPSDKFPVLSLSIIAMFAALSILIWEANVCFLPFVALAIAVIYRNDWKRLLYAESYVLILCGLIVGILFLVGSLISFGSTWTPALFINWVANYGGAKLAIWGKFELSRIVPTVKSFIASMIPLNAGLGISDLRGGGFNLTKIPSLIALLILILLIAVPAYYAVRRLYTRDRIKWVALALSGFVLYLPFIFWWDPFEAKWFVPANIFIWCAIGLLWEPIIKKWHFQRVIYALFVAIIGFATFNATVVSAHAGSDGQYAMATCVSQFMKPTDLHVELFWGWSSHLSYFYHIPNFSIIDSIGKTHDKAKTVESLKQAIALIQSRGDQVYVVDPQTLQPYNWDWIEDITGLTSNDFSFLSGEDVGTCSDYKFIRLAPIKP